MIRPGSERWRHRHWGRPPFLVRSRVISLSLPRLEEMNTRLLLIALLVAIASVCCLAAAAAVFFAAISILPPCEEGANIYAALFIAAPIGFLLGLLGSIPLMIAAAKQWDHCARGQRNMNALKMIGGAIAGLVGGIVAACVLVGPLCGLLEIPMREGADGIFFVDILLPGLALTGALTGLFMGWKCRDKIGDEPWAQSEGKNRSDS